MRKLYNAFCLFSLLAFASCTGPKKVVYFLTDTPQDTSIRMEPSRDRAEIIIQSNDIVSISISSITNFSKDPVGIFNTGGNQVSTGFQVGGGIGGQTSSGYLVDKAGLIDFPVLGKVKLSGMTLRQAKDMMAERLKEYIKDPVVDMRITNYRITMLGEVGRIGPVTSPNNKLNLIEAVAQAGDIPLTGRKDNILVIREENGVRKYARVNLNSRDVFNNPYFYLQQNDIVYVEPNRLRRQEANEFLRFYLPSVLTMIGSLASAYGIYTLSRQIK